MEICTNHLLIIHKLTKFNAERNTSKQKLMLENEIFFQFEFDSL